MSAESGVGLAWFGTPTPSGPLLSTAMVHSKAICVPRKAMRMPRGPAGSWPETGGSMKVPSARTLRLGISAQPKRTSPEKPLVL